MELGTPYIIYFVKKNTSVVIAYHLLQIYG